MELFSEQQNLFNTFNLVFIIFDGKVQLENNYLAAKNQKAFLIDNVKWVLFKNSVC